MTLLESSYIKAKDTLPMIRFLRGTITPTRSLGVLAMAGLCVVTLAHPARAQSSFGQDPNWPSYQTNAWYAAAARPTVPARQPGQYNNGQWIEQPASEASAPAHVDWPISWLLDVVNRAKYANLQGQQAIARHPEVTRAEAPHPGGTAAWTPQYQSAWYQSAWQPSQPTGAAYAPAMLSYPLSLVPAPYGYAQGPAPSADSPYPLFPHGTRLGAYDYAYGPAQPSSSSFAVAPQQYAPPSWQIQYPGPQPYQPTADVDAPTLQLYRLPPPLVQSDRAYRPAERSDTSFPAYPLPPWPVPQDYERGFTQPKSTGYPSTQPKVSSPVATNGAQRPAPWLDRSNDSQGQSQPSSALYPVAQHSHAPTPRPVAYHNGQTGAAPANTMYVPAQQSYAPVLWPVQYQGAQRSGQSAYGW